MKKQLITGVIALGAVLFMGGCGADSSSDNTNTPATKILSMSHDYSSSGQYSQFTNIAINTTYDRAEIHILSTLDISQEDYVYGSDIAEEKFDPAPEASGILTCAATDTQASANNIPVCTDVTTIVCEEQWISTANGNEIQARCWFEGYPHQSTTIHFELIDGSNEEKTYVPAIVGYDDKAYTSTTVVSTGQFMYFVASF